MNVLVVNAGSSSLKLRVLGRGDEVLGSRDLRADLGRPDPAEVARALAELADTAERSGDAGAGGGAGSTGRGSGGGGSGSGGAIVAVGHRIVHGGVSFTAPVVVDAAVEKELHALASLAPLHQPAALAALAAVRAAWPDAVQVACFDTAFHARLPPAAATYAVPAAWRARYGIRRYGFHGLSHAYAARRAAELTGARRVVSCHLGSGASLAAVLDGVGLDTTMGFTPLEGLVMATRSGTVDPGLLLWLQTSAGFSAEELTDALFHSCGLLALAGTPDMRVLTGRAAAGEPDARLALAVYLHRLRAEIAAMAAATGGMDALVFTGGVGERSAPVRSGAAAGLGFLGVALDPGRNAGHRGGDAEVSAPGAAVRTLVVEAREDVEIARGVRTCLRAAPS